MSTSGRPIPPNNHSDSTPLPGASHLQELDFEQQSLLHMSRLDDPTKNGLLVSYAGYLVDADQLAKAAEVLAELDSPSLPDLCRKVVLLHRCGDRDRALCAWQEAKQGLSLQPGLSSYVSDLHTLFSTAEKIEEPSLGEELLMEHAQALPNLLPSHDSDDEEFVWISMKGFSLCEAIIEQFGARGAELILEVMPDTVHSVTPRCMAQAYLKTSDEAQQLLQECREDLTPGMEVVVYLELGRILFLKGDYVDAVEMAKKAGDEETLLLCEIAQSDELAVTHQKYTQLASDEEFDQERFEDRLHNFLRKRIKENDLSVVRNFMEAGFDLDDSVKVECALALVQAGRILEAQEISNDPYVRAHIVCHHLSQGEREVAEDMLRTINDPVARSVALLGFARTSPPESG